MKALGFTLTEMLVVLAILGLLAYFGLPPLLQYGTQKRLTTCQAALTQIARLQSQWFSDHRSYASLSQLGYPVDSSLAAIYLNKDSSIAGHASADAVYRITVRLGSLSAGEPTAQETQASGAAYYLITAQPINDQAGDSRCGTLSLASTGQVGATGTQGEAACWQK
jgi:type IV pilus assembly protein PilE